MGTFDEEVPNDGFPPGATKERPKKLNGSHGAAPILEPIPKGESAFSLTERDMPQPVRHCDPWATEGVNMIAGRPKLGKTTLERQKLAAAATAGQYLDSRFDKETMSAFLSLEEGALLCREKFKQAKFPETALASIDLFFEWPRGYDGAQMLDRYLTENPERKIIVIDSLTKFRTIPDSRTPAFQADYNAINDLHEVAKKHPGVCIDLIHHTRKAKSDDPMDDVSGTYGLTAAVDSITVLRHHADGATMHVAGRLWSRNDNQFTLRRENGGWSMLGAFLDITEKQREALEMVKGAPSGLSGKELSESLGITPPSAWQRLDELLEKGLVTKRYGRCYAK